MFNWLIFLLKLTIMYRFLGGWEGEGEGEEVKKKNNKCNFLKIFFPWILYYSTYSVITASGTQQVNFMEKCYVNAGISFRFILY